MKHLERGRELRDPSLFNDSIYRCNQAFEGSVKEAYRVIAGKNPSKLTPADIEKFLEENRILQRRVLNQFTSYRREWRNPSTHDYTLIFDEDEALLAVVSVTAFAIVLCDQMADKVGFESASSKLSSTVLPVTQVGPLLDQVAAHVQNFANKELTSKLLGEIQEIYSGHVPDIMFSLG